MFLFVCLQFCGCSTDNIGVFGTFGCKTLVIMLICIGDGIRDSLIKMIPGVRDPVDDCLATALRTVLADFISWLLTLADQAISSSGSRRGEFRQVSAGLPIRFRGAERR